MSKYFYGLMLVCLSFCCHAEEKTFYSGKELAGDCSKYVLIEGKQIASPTVNDLVAMGKCMGFVYTFFDTHTFVTQIDHEDEVQSGKKKETEVSLFTLPADFTNQKKVDHIFHYLMFLHKNDPKMLEYPASLLMLHRFRLDFPVQRG